MSSNSSIDYLSKDYDGLRAALFDHASRILPQWQSRSEGDFGVAMVSVMAYMGDILSYYGDRIQAEAYLPTATQRVSLLQIANLLGYIPSNGVPATGTVTFETANPGNSVTVPAGTQVSSDYIAAIDSSIIYETDEDVLVPGDDAVNHTVRTASVSVTHGVTRSDVVVGVSDGTPSQQFRIPDTSVLRGTVRVFVADSTDESGDIHTVEWTPLDYLVDAQGSDRVFSTYVDETGATWIVFGDNVNGAIPYTGLNIYATYRVGGGQVGNIGANQIISIVSSTLQGVSIQQSSAITGGADPESNDQIRSNAPRVFRTQNRAVTLQDFIDLALSVPGVLRANAVAGTFTSVSLYVVGPDGLAPSDALIQSVQDVVSAKALAGTTVTVNPPSLIGVKAGTSTSSIVVQVYPRYKQAAVEKDVEKAIQNLLSFANVDFGMTLTVSDFYAAIMSVPGVQFVSIPLVTRAGGAQTGTADMVFRPWEIPTLDSLSVIANGGLV